MSPAYTAVLSSRFRELLQYRAAALAGVGTQLFFGLVRMMIFDGFYGSSTSSQPMTHAEVTTYIWLGQSMFLLTFLSVDREIAALIRTGNVAFEMLRPLDLYGLWFMRSLAGRAAPLLMRAGPIFVVAGLFFGMAPPVSPASGLGFLVAALLGLTMAAALVALLSITMMWTISGEGISRLAPSVIFFFSGILIPLPFFPGWLQPLVDFLPFRGLIDTPFQIYLGNLAGPAALAAIAHQVVWIALLVAVGRALLGRGLGRLVVQGG
jgi:ABC-2 type transport system permease protein